MISIVAVNHKSYEWAKLLIESARRFSEKKHEIVIVENTKVGTQPIQDATVVDNHGEPSHGVGLNVGVLAAQGEFCLVLDIDCHFLHGGWETAFQRALEGHHVVTVPGSEAKPLRPACMFMKTSVARGYDWRSTPGYQGHRVTPDGFDVGIIAYHEMVAAGLPIRWMEIIGKKAGRYPTINGEEYALMGIPYFYHHWHGTHLEYRQKDYPDVDLAADKELLFRSIPWKKKTKFA